jgi:hypothetical protein
MGGSMATKDLIRARPSGDSFAKNPVEFWGPPLAPTGTLDGDDMSLRQALGPTTRDERFFKSFEKSDFAEPGTGFEPQSDFAEPGTGFEPHRKLIAGIVILAALGIFVIAFIWASTGEKKTTQSEQSAPAVQFLTVLTPASASDGLKEARIPS